MKILFETQWIDDNTGEELRLKQADCAIGYVTRAIHKHEHCYNAGLLMSYDGKPTKYFKDFDKAKKWVEEQVIIYCKKNDIEVEE